ncbi:J domain-containing protein [Paenarthrobacter sp. Z7-10]|uniref:J domain-containing protein n=1 Tax=Paenarthrobacter sp. Z7-10 TaxID=2787635 RepID=UPI0022A93438|nr:J domain-containing protein [Paenarthrobacter sp. Z7-10]MCZ2403691.1 J domain-containing protein [Paenarthrobacter sp. Z7-10]
MADDSRGDLYEVLNVQPDASTREITHVYQALVRAHHPDVQPATLGVERAEGEAALAVIMEA